MVRLAKECDIIGVLKVIRDHSGVVDLKCAKDSFSSSKTAIVIKNSISNGLCVVSISDDKVVGVCLGVITLNAHCDTTKDIHLLDNVIYEDYRKSTLGGRMFIEWCKASREVRDLNDDIKLIWVAQLPTVTNINFEKRGFRLAHTNWVMEEI